jgi:hypothetical protein
MVMGDRPCFSCHAVSHLDGVRTPRRLLTGPREPRTSSLCTGFVSRRGSTSAVRYRHGPVLPRIGGKEAAADAFLSIAQTWRRVCIKMAGDRLKLRSGHTVVCQGPAWLIPILNLNRLVDLCTWGSTHLHCRRRGMGRDVSRVHASRVAIGRPCIKTVPKASHDLASFAIPTAIGPTSMFLCPPSTSQSIAEYPTPRRGPSWSGQRSRFDRKF